MTPPRPPTPTLRVSTTVSSSLHDNVPLADPRDDASLSIIVVSDEQDSSPLGVNSYINEFYDIKGARNRDIFNASALVAVNLDVCPGAQTGSSTGTRYVDVARQTGGVAADMCEAMQSADGFENIVFDLSLTTSRLRNVYFLSEEPALRTLQVSVEDDIIPCDTGRWHFEWVFDETIGEDRPAVVFDLRNMPPVGAQIAARFFRGTAVDDEFCQADDAPAE